MNGAGYKVLGFAVWRGARWYVRRNYGHLVSSRRLAVAGVGVVVVAGVAVAGRRAASSAS